MRSRLAINKSRTGSEASRETAESIQWSGMFRLSRIRRKLLLGAGLAIIFPLLSLVVVESAPVRRFALVQLQTLLREKTGLVVDTKELNYNLLASRYEVRGITIRSLRANDMEAPLKAERLVVVAPFWSLVRGSLDTAEVRIDGLSVSVLTGQDGRTNWPAFNQTGGSGPFAGPAVLITGGKLALEDGRSGLRADAKTTSQIG
jgi:hypothetical protein